MLLHVAFSLFVELLGAGGFALIEHPAVPSRVRAPSIWKLSHVQWLLRSPAVTSRTFKQSVHGQIAAKPTTFLLLRLDGISKYLYSFQGHSVPLARVQQLHGRNASGAWNTAAAKEYPPSLCRAIACAVKDSIDGRQDLGVNAGDLVGVGVASEDLWRMYGHFYQQFDVYDPASVSTTIGADCALFNHGQ